MIDACNAAPLPAHSFFRMLVTGANRPAMVGREMSRPAEDVGDELLRALQRGDARAIERTLRLLLPKVRGWLFRLLGPREYLDDAVQDALVELARALPRYEARGSLEGLARTITVRTAYRYFGRRATPIVDEANTASDGADPEARFAGRQALTRVHAVLQRLPENRRVAFFLCAVEGLTPTEAAEIEGITAVAMRSRVFHARSEVARMLADDPELAPLAARLRDGGNKP